MKLKRLARYATLAVLLAQSADMVQAQQAVPPRTVATDDDTDFGWIGLLGLVGLLGLSRRTSTRSVTPSATMTSR